MSCFILMVVSSRIGAGYAKGSGTGTVTVTADQASR